MSSAKSAMQTPLLAMADALARTVRGELWKRYHSRHIRFWTANMKGNSERQKVPSILPFCGKANAIGQGGAGFHPIVYHSLDVAAVGTALIARDRERLKRIATAVGIGVGPLSNALPFFLTLHDIGKYSRVFQ